MKNRLKKIAFELAAQLSDYPLQYIVLFGSAARGDVDAKSDLDIFLVFDTDKKPSGMTLNEIHQMATNIEVKYDVSIDIVFSNRNYDGFDSYFLQKVFSEGLILYARSPQIELNGMPVRPFTFVTYTFKGVSPASQVKLNTQLYGEADKTNNRFSQGLLKSIGGLKLGDHVLMLPTKNLGRVKALFDIYRVPYSEIETWLFA